MNIILLLHLFMLTFTFGHVELLTVDYHSIDSPIVELNNHTLREVFDNNFYEITLPNGIHDTIENGYKIKRVKKYTLQASDIDYINLLNFTNYDFITISLNAYLGWMKSGTGHYFPNYPNSILTADNISTANTSYVGTYYGSDKVGLRVPKGKYVSLAEAQFDLAGTDIYYQLATPIETEIGGNVTLTSQQMDLYFEMYQENISGDDVSYVQNEMTITDLTYIIGFAFVWIVIIWSIRKVVL